MTDAHDAVEMMEWMIDQKGLTPETAPAERDRLLDALRADAPPHLQRPRPARRRPAVPGQLAGAPLKTMSLA